MELEFNILGSGDSSKLQSTVLEEAVPELSYKEQEQHTTYNIAKLTINALSDINCLNSKA